MLRLTEGSSRPWAAMASAGSTSRGITTELQVISRRSCVEFAFCARLFVHDFYYQTSKPTGKRNYNPLPRRDSQGRQTAASMRLGGNQKAKPSRGEGRERTGGRAATEPQTRCWRGPKEADHGATEPRLCSPWLGGPHTPSSVKQFKN